MGNKANKAQVKVVEEKTSAPTIKDFLAGLDPARMSREEILAYAAKAKEMEEILSRTRESERRTLIDACLNAFEEKAEILGLSESFLENVRWSINRLTMGIACDSPLHPNNFQDKVCAMLAQFPQHHDFQFTWKRDPKDKEERAIWVRIRPQTVKEKKDKEDQKDQTDQADQADKADKAEADKTN